MQREREREWGRKARAVEVVARVGTRATHEASWVGEDAQVEGATAMAAVETAMAAKEVGIDRKSDGTCIRMRCIAPTEAYTCRNGHSSFRYLPGTAPTSHLDTLQIEAGGLGLM